MLSNQSNEPARNRSTRIPGVIVATLTLAALLAVLAASPRAEQKANEPLWETGTFSILGYDPNTGEVGGAVQSRVFSAGNGVLWADANIGIAATQAIIDVSYGQKALNFLKQGVAPADVIKRVLAQDTDPLPQQWSKQGRQFAIMNLKGEFAAYTGPKAPDWAGNKSGKYCTAQGNILAGQQVVENMVASFEKTTGHLSQRLVAALEGGQAGGGDTRGQQSAALVIVKKGCGVWLNNDTVLHLQVDDNPEPIKEMKRLVDLWNSRRPRANTPGASCR
jgi:uncharacterized Ntn-hydrolase superfamily protein